MTAYVFDASALICYLDNESGAERVEAIIGECLAGRARSFITAIQWAEVAGNIRKRHGAAVELRTMNSLLATEIEIVPVSAEQAMVAARLKVDCKISYAEAFALELAMQSAEHLLVTVDYGFKIAEGLARIEYLPTK
jgi:PIN domain nuclease of toxin-antitoxin system